MCSSGLWPVFGTFACFFVCRRSAGLFVCLFAAPHDPSSENFQYVGSSEITSIRACAWQPRYHPLPPACPSRHRSLASAPAPAIPPAVFHRARALAHACKPPSDRSLGRSARPRRRAAPNNSAAPTNSAAPANIAAPNNRSAPTNNRATPTNHKVAPTNRTNNRSAPTNQTLTRFLRACSFARVGVTFCVTLMMTRLQCATHDQ